MMEAPGDNPFSFLFQPLEEIWEIQVVRRIQLVRPRSPLSCQLSAENRSQLPEALCIPWFRAACSILKTLRWLLSDSVFEGLCN